MKFSKLLPKTLIAGLTLIGSSVIIPSEKVTAAACPDPSTTTLTSLATGGDATSFYQVTEDNEAGDGGFCEGTPDSYGVTVYKMGFCTSDPGNPTGSSVLAGSAPDYSSCTWTYQNNSGEAAAFGAGATFSLSDSYAAKPAIGSYDYAVIIIENDFKIKAKYGPIGPVGGTRTTYYTTSTFKSSATSTTDIPPSTWAASTAPLDSFDPGASCEANTSASVSGGTIYAYLLNSAGTIIANDSGVSTCSGAERLLGVMNMSSTVNITSATTGLKATFVVTNNGASVIYDSTNNEIEFDSGPFSVSFEVIE
tara:strand:+ start:7592 stop:8515 length:924 start_codon:yes stop_codon:yes gene_type:complete